MKNQYTITEENEWEGETFSYVMMLSDEEFKFIQDHITENMPLRIEPSAFTQHSVDLINKSSRNTYMERIGFYEFEGDLFEQYNKAKNWITSNPDGQEDWELEGIIYDEIFYKGKGLKAVKSL